MAGLLGPRQDSGDEQLMAKGEIRGVGAAGLRWPQPPELSSSPLFSFINRKAVSYY